MRTAARVDANQKKIVDALRRCGASVLITSQLKNCFDCLVGYNGKNYIVEIKDGSKPPSKRKLTKGEQKFADNWRGGTYNIIESIEDAINMLQKDINKTSFK